MQYCSSSSDFFYETSASSLSYYIICDYSDGVYYGTATKSPSEDKLRINIGKRVRDYLDISMPDFREYDGVTVRHPEALRTFVLYDLNGNVLETYKVRIDETKKWETDGVLISSGWTEYNFVDNSPINAHADPRQKVFIGSSFINDNGGTVPVTFTNDYEGDYLTFEILSGGTLRWVTEENTHRNYIHYSMDGGNTWTTIRSSESLDAPEIELRAGDIVKWKGDGGYGGYEGWQYSHFETLGGLVMNIYGNLASINGYRTYGSPQMGYKLYSADYEFVGLFKDTNIVSAENLVIPFDRVGEYSLLQLFSGCHMMVKAPKYLPARTVWAGGFQYMFAGTAIEEAPYLGALNIEEFAYAGMFNSCSALTKVQETLPAKVLYRYCYGNMFAGCRSLVNVPSLPATVLSQGCYAAMFQNCTSLVKAPDLPAKVAVDRCYWAMFRGCTSLSSIKCMFSSVAGGASDVVYQWVQNVAPTGVFYKDKWVPDDFWPVCNGGTGIPCNWNIIGV